MRRIRIRFISSRKSTYSVPHVAFKVDSIEQAMEGKVVLMEPYYPFDGYRVAMIEIEGAPVELIETTLSEEKIWSDSLHKNSVLYPKK